MPNRQLENIKKHECIQCRQVMPIYRFHIVDKDIGVYTDECKACIRDGAALDQVQICNICGIEKQIDEFYKKMPSEGGPHVKRCKKCIRQQRADARYAKHREQVLMVERFGTKDHAHASEMSAIIDCKIEDIKNSYTGSSAALIERHKENFDAILEGFRENDPRYGDSLVKNLWEHKFKFNKLRQLDNTQTE